MKLRLLTLSTILFCSPNIAAAAVQISEVAWMGSSASANDEWIELYNSGAAVDVNGWQLSDGANLSITLAGSIPAGSYAVLERTSDDTAPGPAFQLYTGALSNGGATLTLFDATGAERDRVVGGSNWSVIGGDNESKLTPQRTANGWVTDTPTPGSGSFTTVSEQIESNEEIESTSAAPTDSTTAETQSARPRVETDSQSSGIELTLPDVTLELAVVAPARVQVNAPVEFAVTPSGVGETILNSLQYTWNFGDGTTAEGEAPEHTFTHPGRYVVVVVGEYKRQRQVARFEIEVTSVDLFLEVRSSGAVVITNQSDDEVDIGAYRLAAMNTIRFAPHTIILPGQSITVSSGRTGIPNQHQAVGLYDQQQQLVAWYRPANTAEQSITYVAQTRPAPRISAHTAQRIIDQSPPPQSATDRFTFAAATITPTASVIPIEPFSPPGLTNVAQAATVAETLPRDWNRYAIVLVLVLGVLAVYLLPARGRGEGSD